MTVKIISGGTITSGHNYIDARKRHTNTKAPNYVTKNFKTGGRARVENVGEKKYKNITPGFGIGERKIDVLKNDPVPMEKKYKNITPGFRTKKQEIPFGERKIDVLKNDPVPMEKKYYVLDKKTVKSKPKLRSNREAPKVVQQPAPQRMYVQVSELSQLDGAMQEAYAALTGRRQRQNTTNRTQQQNISQNITMKKDVPVNVTKNIKPVEVQEQSWLSGITSKIYGVANQKTNEIKDIFSWW